MCFSATASFTVGSMLLIGGTYALVKAVKETPDFVAIAAYPIAFGIQQIFEGGVWVNLLNASLEATQPLAFGFLFFSHLFWPLWVPLSIWWLEKRSLYKRLLLALTIIGGLFGASIYFPLFFNDWMQVAIEKGHIGYKTILIYDVLISQTFVRLFYATVILVSLFIAKEQSIKVLGVLILISLLATFFLYEYVHFISVWCFFAAIISTYLIYVIRRSCRQELVNDLVRKSKV